MSDIDRLEEAVSECREMIREAHAATKDLRAAVREAKKELSAMAKDEVAGQIQLEVSRQLEELGERTSEAVSAATQKVIAEFDRFGESLLGKETYWQKASGRRAAQRPDTDVVSLDVQPSEANGLHPGKTVDHPPLDVVAARLSGVRQTAPAGAGPEIARRGRGGRGSAASPAGIVESGGGVRFRKAASPARSAG